VFELLSRTNAVKSCARAKPCAIWLFSHKQLELTRQQRC